MALVLFKQEKNEECIALCDKALEIDHRLVKAWYWKARASAEEAEYDDAIKFFKEALEIEPDNAEAKKWLKETERRNNEYQKKIKMLAQKMFA